MKQNLGKYSYLIGKSEDANDLDGEYYKAAIDGKKAPSLNSFFEIIAKVFSFPDYFGKNFNALDEMLNDLDWLEADNYALIIRNYDDLLIDENKEILKAVLYYLDKASVDWEQVPNFEGEEQFRNKSVFKTYIVRDGSRKIHDDLNEFGFNYLDI